jgi:phosphocarrier protein HPr
MKVQERRTSVPERIVIVKSRSGLHARPAALFVKAATEQPTPVKLRAKDGRVADGRSILTVLALRVRCGDPVTLSAEGEGAEAAIDALAALLEQDLDGPDGQ